MTTEQKHTPGPWYYVTGAAWTTPGGPDDGGQCVATRASAAAIEPSERDANLRLIARAPDLLAENERLRVESDRWQTVWLRKCNENDCMLVQRADLVELNDRLLGALRELMELAAVGRPAMGAAISRARAAIAKAEGK